MATQSSTDDGAYKREYRRIKSLVSSAYVRQTSVSVDEPKKFIKRDTCYAPAPLVPGLCNTLR